MFSDDQNHPARSQKAKHIVRRAKEDKLKRKKSIENEKDTRKEQKWT